MNKDFKIRLINSGDTKATLEIYRPYVQNTMISFEYEVPTPEEWEKRIKTNTADYPWLVCEYNNEIAGYAYGSRHRYRTAYNWSPESTIYLSEKFHGSGIAKPLYEALFALMKLQGYVNVYAGVGLPNHKSEALHKSVGFYEIGIFKKIGYKFGAWHDTKWLQLHLIEHPANPAKPKTIIELENSKVKAILEKANQQLNGKTPKI